MMRVPVPFNELCLRHHKGIVLVTLSDELVEWLDIHCHDAWKLVHTHDNGYSIQFDNDAAMVAYKLRWK